MYEMLIQVFFIRMGNELEAIYISVFCYSWSI